MSTMPVFTSLLLLVSGHRVIGLRRGIAETETRFGFLEPDPSRCAEELRIFKRNIQHSCEQDRKNGETVSEGGCEAEAEAVVSDGDYEVWSDGLLKCDPEKTQLLLWSGYRDEEREDVLRPLRQQGGCVLHSQEDPDTRLGQLLNAPGVNTLKSCSYTKVKAFWVGASRQFASTWAARSQNFASTWAARSQNVTVAIGYHMQEGRSYKTLFDTVFYRSELKAAVQAFRDRLQVNIFFTHSAITSGDMHAATSVIYERARLLSPVDALKFQETTTWHYGNCGKANLSLRSCQSLQLLNPHAATFLHNLGYVYRYGLGVARDFRKARELFELSMQRGSHRSPTSLGSMYHDGQGVAQDFLKAKELYEMAIKRGDEKAFIMLGILYERGQGVVQDFHRAKELYEIGIEKGSAAAHYALGSLYQYGRGVARDFEKAREHYETAMAKGDEEAPSGLGSLYEFGQGVAEDLHRAKELYEIGIETGSAAAPCRLGNMYLRGQGVAQDFHRAKDLYEMGTERGSSMAACSLGRMYYFGFGVTQNFQKARELFELSMQGGWPRAPTNLGFLYQKGHGVTEDFHKAKELYELGMKSGDDLAPELLGHMYRDGLGVYQDWDKAKELYEIGIERGSAEAATSLAYMYQQMARDFKNPGAYSPSMQEQYQSVAFRKAKELYDLAIARGSTSAMWYLALLYKNDLNSDELACQWMDKSKEAGEEQAAGMLAEWRC
eukprot:s1957_g3.t1